MIYITRDPLNEVEITETVRKSSNGAMITFLGTTRDFSAGRNVLYLEYEAYQPMAENMFEQITKEVKEKWNITDMSIAHRIGKLKIGETSLIVAIGSPHRKEAIAATDYTIDRIKKIVPIWKKEFFEGGEVWIGEEGKEYIEELSRLDSQ